MPEQLTAESVRALAIDSRDRIIFDTEPGFGLRVTPAGTKIFVAQARVNGGRVPSLYGLPSSR